MSGKRPARGLPALAREVQDLVVAYLKQETLTPIKGLVHFVVYGLAGSAVLSVGLVLVSLALLRVLQTETGTTFSGSLSWAPYAITLLLCAGVAGAAVRAIGAHRRRAGAEGRPI